jgi:linoleoyl-CoA desaturase
MSLKFGSDRAFQRELWRRVDEYFRTSGRRQRDCWQLYVKTAVLLTSFVVLYGWLVFGADTWWSALLLATLLGLSAAGIGFNVQHDGGHQAYSNRPWVNKVMAMTLELLGGSSYLWRFKHGVLHHTYVNITGHDTDIDLGIIGRLSPHQRRLPITAGSTCISGRSTACSPSSGSSWTTSESSSPAGSATSPSSVPADES